MEVDFVAQLTSDHDLGFGFCAIVTNVWLPATCRNVEDIDELIL